MDSYICLEFFNYSRYKDWTEIFLIESLKLEANVTVLDLNQHHCTFSGLLKTVYIGSVAILALENLFRYVVIEGHW